MRTSLHIRTYEPRDFEQVWALHREGVLETTPEYPEVMAEYEKDLRAIEETYLGDGCGFWVAAGPDGLVGMTAIERLDGATARLRRMRVTAAWRRQGVAQALLDTAEAFCRAQGYRRLVLDTTEHQTAAHALYERNGFSLKGERNLGKFRIRDYEKALR